MPYARLDDTRITSAELAPDRVRIVSEAASSYPEAAGLRRFTRTLTFEAPGRFVVEDRIATSPARQVEWFLHADEAPRGGLTRWSIGPADVWLDSRFDLPPGARIDAGPSFLVSPGQPGSIEQGAREQRGYELKATLPPAEVHRVRVEMRVSISERSDGIW